MDRMMEVAGHLNESIKHEAQRLKQLGLTDNQVYMIITDAVEFILNHLAGDLG